MTSRAVEVSRVGAIGQVHFIRPDEQNAIDGAFLRELRQGVLDLEADEACRIIVLRGSPGCFCTGLDFRAADNELQSSDASLNGEVFMGILRQISESSKVSVSIVDGRTSAGGVGIVAASDLAIATHRSQFSLPEALWGLLPCCVLPFLIRRVGFQAAYTMTLTTLAVEAQAARAMGLVDELVDDPDRALQRVAFRCSRLSAETVSTLKQFFAPYSCVTEAQRQSAAAEATRLMNSELVRRNISNFVHHRVFPWESESTA